MRVVWHLGEVLTGAPPDQLQARTDDAPDPTGDLRFDAVIAAIVDHVLTAAELPLPTWVGEPERTVRPEWDVEPVRALRDAARVVTPDAIRRHGIWLDPAELPKV